MRVLGVDGYSKGWVGVLLSDEQYAGVRTATTFAALKRSSDDVDLFAVDIPIGLPEEPPRLADVAARAFLRPRQSAVCHTYPEPLYRLQPGSRHRDRYAAARTACRERAWPVISSQSFALGARILELVPWSLDERVIEIHPEVSFKTMTGRDLGDKKTWNGMHSRRAALAREGILLPDVIPEARGVPADDLLDAAVGAWTAVRYVRHTAEALPANHPRGIPGGIWR